MSTGVDELPPGGTARGEPERQTEAPGGAATEAASAPLGTPAVAGVAVLLCVGLVAAGLTALRDLVVGRSLDGRAVPGERWLAPAAERATSLVQGDVAVGVGAVTAVLGLVLLVLAALPRPRPATAWRPAVADPPMWVTRAGIGALVSDAALGAPAVETSRARARRRVVDVDVSVDPRDEHSRSRVAEDVSARVEPVLRGLGSAPRLRVHVHGATAP